MLFDIFLVVSGECVHNVMKSICYFITCRQMTNKMSSFCHSFSIRRHNRTLCLCVVRRRRRRRIEPFFKCTIEKNKSFSFSWSFFTFRVIWSSSSLFFAKRNGCLVLMLDMPALCVACIDESLVTIPSCCLNGKFYIFIAVESIILFSLLREVFHANLPTSKFVLVFSSFHSSRPVSRHNLL